MKKKELLIICKEQLGYLTDVYKWCENLKDNFSIRVVCYDRKREKFNIEGVDVVYVDGSWPHIARGVMFLAVSIINIAFFHGHIIVSYFDGCSALKKLFPRRYMFLDIRTMSVFADEKDRRKSDDILKKAVRDFDYVTVISESVRKKLGVPVDKSSIVHLGADARSYYPKDFSMLNLLYLGTLDNRHIEKTLYGLSYAKCSSRFKKPLHYYIAGTGYKNEEEELRLLVKKLELQDQVSILGYIRHDRIDELLQKCNVGVSFIPMTEYFDCQPPTKTYEYIFSGLFTIATATTANKEIIDEAIGLLIDDTPESFGDALLYLNDCFIPRKTINESYLDSHLWKNIVATQLVPLLNR